MGIAIDKSGIVASARKFSLAPGERHSDLVLADDYLATEKGKTRIFAVGNKRFYLSVCYDDFGIAKGDLPVPSGGIDAILSLVHVFTTGHEPGSGESNYARYGLAPASKAWCCRVFNAVVFRKDHISSDWPSGVFWTREGVPTKETKYEDFRIIPDQEVKEVRLGSGVFANIRLYRM
jgi:hypothetical protein